MEFCEKCGSLLTPKKTKKGRTLVCQNCDYVKPLASKKQKTYRIVQKIPHGPDEETIVIDAELTEPQTMPTVRAVCSKCQNKEAYYWQVQTRSGDEGMTTFYRCTKCSYTWREY